MAPERLLDVRDLAPPEPLERVLAALPALHTAQYLRARLPREPYPLYPLLQELGYAWRARRSDGPGFELLIWRRDDREAQIAVQPLLHGG
jgi:hypothetical protein